MHLNNFKNNSTAFSWFLLAILSLVWGSSFILIKKGLLAFSALEVGSIRVISAALFLLPFVFNKFTRWSKKELFYLFVVGFNGSLFPALLFAVAQTRLSSSLTGILNAMTPVFVLIIGLLFFRQKTNIYGLFGIAIGFVGSAILITGFSLESFKNLNSYAFLIILATLCYGLNLNIIKFKLKNVNPTDITGISMALALPSAAVVLLFFTDFATKSWDAIVNPEFLAIIVLGIVGTAIALLLFNKLVKLRSPLFAGSVTYLIPAVATLWGFLDGETLLFYHFAGLVSIISGVLLVNRKKTS